MLKITNGKYMSFTFVIVQINIHLVDTAIHMGQTFSDAGHAVAWVLWKHVFLCYGFGSMQFLFNFIIIKVLEAIIKDIPVSFKKDLEKGLKVPV
jgi:hypothetical protein